MTFISCFNCKTKASARVHYPRSSTPHFAISSKKMPPKEKSLGNILKRIEEMIKTIPLKSFIYALLDHNKKVENVL